MKTAESHNAGLTGKIELPDRLSGIPAEIGAKTTTITTASACSGFHQVIFAGTPPIPEGFPCACGKTKVHYKTCPACGHTNIEMIPVEQIIEPEKVHLFFNHIRETIAVLRSEEEKKP